MVFTDKELAMIAIILDEEEEEVRQVKKRKWVHEAWKKRESEGEFATLYRELIDDETTFSEYFRMSEDCFNITPSVSPDLNPIKHMWWELYMFNFGVYNFHCFIYVTILLNIS